MSQPIPLFHLSSIPLGSFEPHSEKMVTSRLKDEDGETWESTLKQKTNSQGELLLDNSEFLWSMTSQSPGFFRCPDQPILTVEVIVDERVSKIELEIYSKDIVEETVEWIGNKGVIFHPTGAPKAGLILLSGSNGGMGALQCKALATQGYLTLGLPYFAYPGLPENLKEIPLEYFETAMVEFKKHPKLQGKKMGLSGGSRGGELVLLLGSVFPQLMDFIISRCPASSVYGGYDPQRTDHFPAWTLGGEEVPYFQPDSSRSKLEYDPEKAQFPMAFTPHFLDNIENNPESFSDSAIQVEKITCPTLVAGGSEDQLWPAAYYIEKIKSRVSKEASHFEWKIYPGLGHLFPLPHLPKTAMYSKPMESGFSMRLGGDPEKIQQAVSNFYQTMFEFIETA